MAASDWDIADMVLRNSSRYQRMSEEEKRIVDSRFASFLDEENDDYDGAQIEGDTEGDIDMADRRGDASDVEEDAHVEINVDTDEDDDDEELLFHEEGEDQPRVVDDLTYFYSKNGIKWDKDPPASSRIRAHNIFNSGRQKPGPVNNSHDPLTIFRSLITEDMAYIIMRETNRKANKETSAWNLDNPTNKKEWSPLTLKEFDAFVAIVIYAGLSKSNSEPCKELWDKTRDPLYKAAMSFNRFCAIKRFIRFDNASTRPERLETSKTAAIDDVWLMLQQNLSAAYIPHDSITVDEQLFAYRGRTRFTQYIPSKPAKYGIKVWWLCDSKTYYPLKGIIYSGKLPSQDREVNQGQKVVLQLVEKYLNTGRTVYADNFFTTLDLATLLLRQKTGFVGTVRSNKAFIPQEFRKHSARPIHSTMFGFYENDVSLISYVPKKNKAVLLLSTLHYTCDVDNASEKRKPLAILDYNSNKSGVDTMDQMLGTYSSKRSTNRWPLAFFYNMLDVASLAAFIIFNDIEPSPRTDKRRSFLKVLVRQLAVPNMEERATNTHVTRWPNIRNALEAFDVKVNYTLFLKKNITMVINTYK